MPRCNPEEAATALAAIEKSWVAAQDVPGIEGSHARGFPIVAAYYAWVQGEMERGMKPEDVLVAFAVVIGAMTAAVADTIRSPAEPSDERIAFVLRNAAVVARHQSAHGEFAFASIERVQ